MSDTRYPCSIILRDLARLDQLSWYLWKLLLHIILFLYFILCKSDKYKLLFLCYILFTSEDISVGYPKPWSFSAPGIVLRFSSEAETTMFFAARTVIILSLNWQTARSLSDLTTTWSLTNSTKWTEILLGCYKYLSMPRSYAYEICC